MIYSIETKDLTKSYDKTIALDSLNLRIKKGEVYGFIGKNGAGKTTTINLILSLIHKDNGDILINNELVKFKDQKYKSSIGFVPDVPVFPGYLNSEEYLSFTCDVFNITGKEKNQAIDKVLKFVELDKVKKRISGFSRGMKQRLAIAQALVHDPEILIMDEPTSALDPIGRKEVMDIILKLKGKKTIFYSTHILDDVEKVCDRIGLLNKGVLVLEDSIENIQSSFLSNKMYIQTKSEPIEVVRKLQKEGLEAKFFVSNQGILCELNKNVKENDILRRLIDLDETVIEFRRMKSSLEDVFIKLTKWNHY